MRSRIWMVVVALSLCLGSACGSDESSGGAGSPAGGSAGSAGSSTGGTINTGGAAGASGKGGGAGDAGTAGAAGTAGSAGTANGGSAGAAGGAGAAVTLVDGLAYGYRVAVDATHVYFTSAGTYSTSSMPAYDGVVGRVPIAGGAAETISTGLSASFYGLAVDASNAYVGLATDQGGMETFLMKLPKAGGATATLDSNAAPLFVATDAANPGANAAWVYYGRGPLMSRISVSGGAPTTIASQSNGEPQGVAVDGQSAYWSNGGGWDPQNQPLGDGKVVKAPVAGGALTELVGQAGTPYGLAIDDTSVYFVDIKGGDVWKVGKDGAGATKLATGQAAPYDIAVDATDVYWTNRGAQFWTTQGCAGKGEVRSIPKAGGASKVLATSLNCASGIAVDAVNVYWAEAGTQPKSNVKDGAIRKIAK